MGFAKIAGAVPVLLCLALTGCQPKAGAAAADGAPRDSALVEGGFIPGDPANAAVSTSADQSTLDVIRKYEAPEISGHPEMASRKGDVLFITMDGTPVARFTDRRSGDCMTNRTCINWSFRGAAALVSLKGKREPYALIMQDGADGWSHFTFVGGERGLTWFSNWPEISPEGRYVAEGSREGMDVAGYFRIVDWATSYPHDAYVFEAGCHPLKWTRADTLQVNCDHAGKDGAFATVATVKRDAKGQWRLTETAEVAFDDAERLVGGSKLKLRTLDAKPAGPDVAREGAMASRKVATEAQLVAEGMDWLGPAGP